VRLAIQGGSFNPVHLGHLFLADTVLSTLNYDRVVLVPAFCSPFKPDAGIEGDANNRLEMVAASVASDHRIAVDGCEIERGGVSYTAETIEDIILRYAPEGKPGLVIGDDLAEDFSQWKNSGDILAMADIIIARRVHSGKLDVSYPHVQIFNDVMDISSAAVRKKIAAGEAWRCLVPAAAGNIIEDRGLYGFRRRGETGNGSAKSPGKNLIVRVEEAARKSLSLERFLHSRNTALLALDICSRLGPVYAARYGKEEASPLNPEQGYLAGIAHDLAKQIDGAEMLRLAKKDGKKITRLEKQTPNLLHGRASAVLLKERFGVNDDAVLEAVALHTGGGENMGPLAKVVFIADKMEVSRENIEPAVRNLTLFDDNLDRIFFAVLERNMARVRAKNQEISEETLRLYEKMKKMPGITPEGKSC